MSHLAHNLAHSASVRRSVRLSVRHTLLFRRLWGFWLYHSCPKAPLTSNMAPALPHATGVAVYPALFMVLHAFVCASAWAATSSGPASPGWVSKQDWEERGEGHLAEHLASNKYFPTPPPRQEVQGEEDDDA